MARMRRAKLALGLALASYLLWTYLRPVSLLLYGCFWWTFYSGGLTLVEPAPADGADGSSNPLLVPVVPKLLHQTWKDSNVTGDWAVAQSLCQDYHQDWTYKLWTDEDALQLIATKFPWFLETYKSYPHNIQRADALRYFVLYEYGGVYLDLDIACFRNLDFLRYYEFVAPKTTPIGVSNDLMVSMPRGEFVLRLTQQLAGWQKWFFIKYATVMLSTGPMFVTLQMPLYRDKADLAVLPPELYLDKTYFAHITGSSWHGSDGKAIAWMSKHGAFCAVGGLVAVAAYVARRLRLRLRLQAGGTLGRGSSSRGHGGGFGDAWAAWAVRPPRTPKPVVHEA